MAITIPLVDDQPLFRKGVSKMKERNRYLKIVEWSEEDQCYIGSVPGWIGKCCHGDNEEKVYQKLR